MSEGSQNSGGGGRCGRPGGSVTWSLLPVYPHGGVISVSRALWSSALDRRAICPKAILQRPPEGGFNPFNAGLTGFVLCVVQSTKEPSGFGPNGLNIGVGALSLNEACLTLT